MDKVNATLAVRQAGRAEGRAGTRSRLPARVRVNRGSRQPGHGQHSLDLGPAWRAALARDADPAGEISPSLSRQERVVAALAGQRLDAVPLDLERWRDVTAERHRLRGYMRGIARCDEKLSALVQCGRGRTDEYVELWRRLDGACYVGRTVPRCGSVQACPVCSPVKRAEYAGRIADLATGWELAGGGILLFAFTVPHAAGDRLEDTYQLVNDGFRWMTSTKAWKLMRARLGTFEWARCVECTHGANGFHPHTQGLIFVDGDRVADAIEELYKTAWPLWRRYVLQRTGVAPTVRHGIDVQVCGSPGGAGRYLAKSSSGFTIAEELTRGDLKLARGTGSRTYFQILKDYADRPGEADGRLLLEYMQATHRKRAFSFSRGFKRLVGVIDEDGQADDERAELAALLPGPAWDAAEPAGAVPALLYALAAGGRDALDAVLRVRGLPVSLDPWPDVGQGP